MRRELLLAAITASLVAPPAFAFQNLATRADPLVCKRDRQTNIGSHFRAPRTCMLRSQWREVEEQTQHELQQILDGRAANSPAENEVPALGRRPL